MRKVLSDKTKNNKFTFIDLFAGIGGFRIALEELGGECLGFSEINKSAIAVYKNNFNTLKERELGDIKKISKYLYSDIVCGGVPCQSWSVAGKKHGFDDPRGALWFDTINYVNNAKPKAFIFENVKGLADPRNKDNLNLIINSFEKLGYNTRYKVLNSFDFSLPQNRERIFIVGIRNDIQSDYQFPFSHKLLPRLLNIIDDEIVGSKDASQKNKLIKNSFSMSNGINRENFFTFCDTRNGEHTVHSWDILETTEFEKEICLTILKNRRKKKYGERDGNPMSFEDISNLIPNVKPANISSLVKKKILKVVESKYDFLNSKNSSGIFGIYRIYTPDSHVFSTLTKTGSRDFISTICIPNDCKDKKKFFLENIFQKKRFRKLTLKEAIRLQGFPDNFKLTSSYNTNLALLGNSLGVSVAKAVAEQLILNNLCTNTI